MVKVLFSSLLFLLIAGCSEQEATEQNMINIQAAMLKALCEDDSACVNKIDTLAKSCHRNNDKNFDELSEKERMIAGGEFFGCIIRQMDQDFQNRFAEAIPVTETGVETTRPSTNANTKGLLVRLMQDGIRFTDKSKQRNTDVPLKDLKKYIQDQKLAENHSMVSLFVDEETDTGDMVEVMDVFKSAGIEKIHVAGGNR